MEQLRLRVVGRNLSCIAASRKQEQKTALIGNQVVILHIARILNHVAVEIVLKIPDAVNIHPGRTAVLEKQLFIAHPVLSEQFHGLVGVDAPLHERKLRLHKLRHPRLHLADERLIHRHAADELAIDAVSHGKLDLDFLDFLSRNHVIKGL